MDTPVSLPMLYFAVSNPQLQAEKSTNAVAVNWQYGSFRVSNLKHALEFLSAFKSLGWCIHQAWVIDTDGFKLTIPPEHIDDRLLDRLGDLPALQRSIDNLVFHSFY
ncbi:hypothetical protein DYU11_12075 [Fibrisoma montanum]|uniref:Uncharacterized protein n=1 Tax=Fibrisoma montanum TaxID=2305895 RepID=A0A418MBG0_9BACT|nr:hypothetical protein [Fibrisoma montanum]RIV23708.1 hypothetical protein DYU11_12075 [Fibrisoma montanum]